MNVRELLGRLGSPIYRHRCARCQQLVDTVTQAAVWGRKLGEYQLIEVCARCEHDVERMNETTVRERVSNEIGAKRVNREYFQRSDRPSSFSYREACERMRREGF